MRKTKLIGLSLLIAGSVISCGPKGNNSVTTVKDSDGNILTLCDYSKVNDTIDIPLSEWVEDCQLIRFENKDTALFKLWWPVISSNYIGIRQSEGAFKLFDRNGKFLHDIGKVGQGPGEYSGSIYDEIIDETADAIYLAPFFNSSKILKNNMDGTFARDIEVGEKMNKPKIALNNDGSVSMIHLCFENQSKIFSAVIDKTGKATSYKGKAGQIVNPLDKEGNYVGFDNEIWSYKNTPEFTYMITGNDTLFVYNPKDGNSKPRFTVTNLPKNETFFSIYLELPQKYIANFWGKGVIVVDKATNDSHYVRLKNDKFGGINAPFNFTNGYFFAMYEPALLMEKIEKRLSESSCTEKDKTVLNKLLDSLNEDDNNVMFVGKLKK